MLLLCPVQGPWASSFAIYNVISLLNSPVGRILQRWRCSCFAFAWYKINVHVIDFWKANNCKFRSTPSVLVCSDFKLTSTK